MPPVEVERAALLVGQLVVLDPSALPQAAFGIAYVFLPRRFYGPHRTWEEAAVHGGSPENGRPWPFRKDRRGRRGWWGGDHLAGVLI